MTVQEFSDQFDLLYNNITSNQAPGLDEYEKSVFLTKAQDEILKAYFDPRGNKFQEGFDGSQKRQIDFSNLIETIKLDITSTTPDGNFDERAKKVTIAETNSIMFIINEIVKVTRGTSTKTLQVLPLTFAEYQRLMNKPYQYPNKNQAWRLITGKDDTDKNVEILVGPNDSFPAAGGQKPNNYIIRYVKRPYPIILQNLGTSNLSINGYIGANSVGAPIQTGNTATQGLNCELDPILHEEILQRAVELAKAAFDGTLNSQFALGSNSETNIGIVPQQQQSR